MPVCKFFLPLLFLISVFSLAAENRSLIGFVPHYRIYWNDSAENRLGRVLFSPSQENNPHPFKLQEEERFSFPRESFLYWNKRLKTLLLHYSGEWNSWIEFRETINHKEREWFWNKTVKNKMIPGISLSGSADFFYNLSENSLFLSDLMEWTTDWRVREINIDWEYPRNENDFILLKNLINQIKKEIPYLNVTLCISRFAPLDNEAMKAADQIYLMAYDYYGNHSTFENAEEFIDYLQLNRSVSSTRMVLGIPFYGRNFSLFEQELWYKPLSYRALLADYNADPENNTIESYFYNGRKLIKDKIALSEEKKIAGLMIWELLHDSGDPERALLEAFPEK